MCEVGSKFCKYCQCDHPLTEEWWNANRGKLRVCKRMAKDYQTKNKERINAYNSVYDKINANRRQEYRNSARHERREYSKQYYQENIERIREYRQNYPYSLYEKTRKETDIVFRITKNLRSRLRGALQRNEKTGSAIKDLGCTVEQLKQHLESKFQDGMTWDNHGLYGWHIDHIIPLSSFDLTDREQLLKACNYTNLQPLWAEENLKKSDKCPLKD